MTTPDFDPQDYPSLDLAFDWLKDALDGQTQEAELCASRAATIFSVGTAVTGISAVFSLDGTQNPGCIALVLWVLIGLSYITSMIFTLAALWPVRFERLRDIRTMREDYWGLQPSVFKKTLLEYMEKYYPRNSLKVYWRVIYLRGLVITTGAALVLMLLSLWLGL